ncbi:MAG: cupin domain-containing protein [Clostridiaceae bacterium]
MLREFPGFIKRTAKKVPSSLQNTQDVEGYFYESSAGGQVAFWTCAEAHESKPHTHPFDEYMVVLSGEYTVCLPDGETVLHPGDEFLIPAGTPQCGRCAAQTRTIHAFGGKRILDE